MSTQIVLCSVFTYVRIYIHGRNEIPSHKQIQVLLVITLRQTRSRDEGSDKDWAYTPDSLPMRSGEDDPTLNEQKICNSQLCIHVLVRVIAG